MRRLQLILYFAFFTLWTLNLWGQGAATQWISPRPASQPTTDPLHCAKQWLGDQSRAAIYRQSSFHWDPPTYDLHGGAHLTATQYYGNFPVFDGFVRFHFSKDGKLQRIQEHLLPLESIPTAPLLTPASLHSSAFAQLRQRYPHVAYQDWRLKHTQTSVFHPAILRAQAAEQAFLAYVQHWEHPAGLACALYWDTQRGKLLALLQQHCQLYHHQLYEGSSPQVVWQSGEDIPSDFDQWKRWQISATKQTYHLFRSAFGRESYDGQGADFQSRANAELSNCPNARWTGTSTQFCPGTSADDVVAHEWGHAYTQYTSNLTYAWQSGAINEAYSDIWGEIVDLLNDEGNDQDDEVARTDCANSLRWKIAEDVSVLNGPIRDLWNPNCLADPASTSDPLYDCGNATESGSVHTNTGPVNRTFALLVDGDGSQPGIGLTKAAHLFWHAQAHYLSRTSDFRTLAAALGAAYQDLRGQELTELRLTDTLRQLSGQSLGPNDSLWLQHVLGLTGLPAPLTQCPNYAPLLGQSPPSICEQSGDHEFIVFAEDFEQGLAGWQVSAHPTFSVQWQPRQWTIANFLPAGRNGQAAFAAVPNNGSLDPKQGGLLRLESPRIELPPTEQSNYHLSFLHYLSLEPGDGAHLTYRHNEAAWEAVPPAAFRYNSYQEILPGGSSTNGNPLVGEWIFTGTDQGSNSGSWGSSIVDLSALGVSAGDSLWLRWELGTDHSAAYDGWFIDDVVLSSCQPEGLLPVEWLSFTATAGAHAIVLDWATATEDNNSGFFVERSLDGQRYLTVGWVPAAARQQYNWEDKDVHIGQWYYYRLRQVDLDGQSAYSAVQRARIRADQQQDLWVYPNPVQEQLHIRSHPNEPIQALSLYNSTGQVVRQRAAKVAGTTSFQLSTTDLPPGTYILAVELPSRQHQQLIVVLH